MEDLDMSYSPSTLDNTPDYYAYKKKYVSKTYLLSPIFGFSEGEIKRKVLTANYRQFAQKQITRRNNHSQLATNNTLPISYYSEKRQRYKYSDFQFINWNKLIYSQQFRNEETQVTPSLYNPSKGKTLKKDEYSTPMIRRDPSPLSTQFARSGQYEIINNLNKLQERINNLSRLYDQ